MPAFSGLGVSRSAVISGSRRMHNFPARAFLPAARRSAMNTADRVIPVDRLGGDCLSPFDFRGWSGFDDGFGLRHWFGFRLGLFFDNLLNDLVGFEFSLLIQ